jgi:hypothetical protein
VALKLPKHLQVVKRELRKINERLDDLRAARRHRRTRTLYWRNVYKRRKKKYGEDDRRTKDALHKARISQQLGEEIKKTQRVLIIRAERKLKRLKKFEKNHPPKLDPDGDGLITIDGKQAAKEVGKEVLRIRKAGRWKGYIVSGYRTPAYSESLCYNMCGRPFCSGMCAGRSTNHARKGGRSGAVDLTDYITFRYECQRLGSFLENHLPRDLVHFSDSGV